MQCSDTTITLAPTEILEQEEWSRKLPDRSYANLWPAKTGDINGFTPLVLTTSRIPNARAGTAITHGFLDALRGHIQHYVNHDRDKSLTQALFSSIDMRAATRSITPYT